MQSLIYNTAKEELSLKGYELSEAESSDFEVFIYVKNRPIYYLKHFGYHDGYKYHHVGKDRGSFHTNFLEIMLYDLKLRKHIWIGSLVIDKQSYSDNTMKEAVVSILKEFPPEK